MKSDTGLTGKAALVTGAAQGAGMGIALELAREGVCVALVGRTELKLHAIAAQIQAEGGSTLVIRCDVGHAHDIDVTVERVLREFGRLDILANVAQSDVRAGALLEIAEHDIQLLWDTGPLATLRFMRACYPYLRGSGSIVNFGSSTQFAPQGYGVYAGAKDAITAISRAAAVEWGPDGIRCNVIAPAVLSPSLEADLSDPVRRRQTLARKPLGRFAEPSEVGKVAVFLCSQAAAMITGQLILVDGGSTYHR